MPVGQHINDQNGMLWTRIHISENLCDDVLGCSRTTLLNLWTKITDEWTFKRIFEVFPKSEGWFLKKMRGSLPKASSVFGAKWLAMQASMGVRDPGCSNHTPVTSPLPAKLPAKPLTSGKPVPGGGHPGQQDLSLGEAQKHQVRPVFDHCHWQIYIYNYIYLFIHIIHL